MSEELEKEWEWLREDCEECYQLNKHEKTQYLLICGAALPQKMIYCDKHVNLPLLKRFVKKVFE